MIRTGSGFVQGSVLIEVALAFVATTLLKSFFVVVFLLEPSFFFQAL